MCAARIIPAPAATPVKEIASWIDGSAIRRTRAKYSASSHTVIAGANTICQSGKGIVGPRASNTGIAYCQTEKNTLATMTVPTPMPTNMSLKPKISLSGSCSLGGCSGSGIGWVMPVAAGGRRDEARLRASCSEQFQA